MLLIPKHEAAKTSQILILLLRPDLYICFCFLVFHFSSGKLLDRRTKPFPGQLYTVGVEGC